MGKKLQDFSISEVASVNCCDILFKKIYLMALQARKREVVFVCVGNPKYYYDSFAYMVFNGIRQLRVKTMPGIKFIFVGFKAGLFGSSTGAKLVYIKSKHPNALIIAIDSALAKHKDGLGCLVFEKQFVSLSHFSHAHKEDHCVDGVIEFCALDYNKTQLNPFAIKHVAHKFCQSFARFCANMSY